MIEEYEDTVIQNNDTYIEKLIHDKKPTNPRYSESVTMTISPNYGTSMLNHQLSYGGLLKSPTHHRPPPLHDQMSQDFLLVVENLQNELHQKGKALQIITKQLKEKQRDFDKMMNNNEA